MKEPKYYLYFTPYETRMLQNCLVRFKTRRSRQDRYTDCVDELILKVSCASGMSREIWHEVHGRDKEVL